MRTIATALRLPGAPQTQLMNESHVRLSGHGLILNQKPQFTSVVVDMQSRLLTVCEQWSSGLNSVLEVGSGVVPLKRVFPQALAADIEIGEDIDCVLDAHHLPFPNASFDVVVCQNAFHHFKDPLRALKELTRILKIGGILLIVDPLTSRFASLIYPHLFDFEGYDPASQSFNYLPVEGGHIPNQALSHVVFVANKCEVMKTLPGVEFIHSERLTTGLRYLLSGGLNFKPLVPSIILNLCKSLERQEFAQSLLKLLAIHWLVVLRKEKAQEANTDW